MSKAFEKILSVVDLVFTALGGAALLYMMSITVLDIIGRSLRLFTIDSGVEQTELLMVAIGFLGLARCLRIGGNIVVDIATHHLPPRVNVVIDAFWLLVTVAVLGLLAVLVLQNGIDSDTSGQRSELLGLSPLVGHVVAVLGMIAAAVVALATAWRGFIGNADANSVR
jgi:TRAP-type C4-dicarboxylate transport system permease small subunit